MSGEREGSKGDERISSADASFLNFRASDPQLNKTRGRLCKSVTSILGAKKIRRFSPMHFCHECVKVARGEKK